MKLPRILITAMRSGAGKTMLTCGILKAMKMQEINPASFKCGPDYIDPMFHKTMIGISSYNLDSFLCGENGVREILKKNGAGADISVMEGVMGYYDGIAGISSYGCRLWCRCYHIYDRCINDSQGFDKACRFNDSVR